MKRGFFTIMAAQFFSSLADNALFVGAVQLLRSAHAPEWQQAALVPMFALFYVVLAPFVGAYADAYPKGRVMLVSNGIKIVGCLLMLFGSHPLMAYAVVGLGAAAYSPAKYGILTELLPASQLVKANGWIEGLTIASIILGVLVGGQLVSPHAADMLLGIDVPFFETGIDTAPEAAIALLILLYALAATQFYATIWGEFQTYGSGQVVEAICQGPYWFKPGKTIKNGGDQPTGRLVNHSEPRYIYS